MYKITLRNNKNFFCTETETLVDAAKKNYLTFEHSWLPGRCYSCRAKVLFSESVPKEPELALNSMDFRGGYVLTFVRVPLSDIETRRRYHNNLLI